MIGKDVFPGSLRHGSCEAPLNACRFEPCSHFKKFNIMNKRIPENCSPYIFPGLGMHIKSIMEVAEIACKHLHIDLSQITIHSRKREIVKNRQIVFHLCYHYGYGCSAIARFFPPFDHATVLHSARIVKSDMMCDKELRKIVNMLYELIKG